MHANNNSTETPTPSGISRRTVVKGAAWAVPAIAVASAVPAMAASRECLTYTFTPDACKFPGATNFWSYRLSIQICNACPTPITLTITSIKSGSTGLDLTPCGTTPFPSRIIVPANDCFDDAGPYFVEGTNSGNFIELWGYLGTAAQTPIHLTASVVPSGQGMPTNDIKGCTGNPCA